ncbi:MAG: hypothetical protein CMI91_00335 [Pelagibacteraceae bacterium]|nr:hypothetical protein [Pelagibacteraceae bacterium]|tara:strand:- start:343 stop:792 length:450 start_codon:yes stop_codon:yes gene_type:complete
MKEIIYVLFIITTISSNKVFSQEENSIYYITDLRGDISLEMEINNLQSNNGPLYIRILDENENPVIVGTSPVINYSARISFDSISPGKYAIQFFHDENENQKMDFSLIGIPKEKFGSSNNVKPILGPPKFEKMLFNLTENKKVIMVPVN